MAGDRATDRAPPPGSRDGFVLPTVLAVLLVISAVAAAVTTRTRGSLALTGAATERLALDAAADGVVRLVGLWLALEARGRVPPSGLPLDGRALRCPLGDGRAATLAVQDQGGLLDLNASSRPVLEEVLRRIGIPDAEALALAAQIVDFRDPDDVPEPGGGAEARRYREEGLAHGPRNAPFATPDELDQLPAMTPALYAAIRPAVTVQNGRAGFDAQRMDWRLARRLAPETLGRLAALQPSDGVRFEVSVLVESAQAGQAAQPGRAVRAGIVALDDPTRPAGAVRAWRWPEGWQPGEAVAGHPACRALAQLFAAEP